MRESERREREGEKETDTSIKKWLIGSSECAALFVDFRRFISHVWSLSFYGLSIRDNPRRETRNSGADDKVNVVSARSMRHEKRRIFHRWYDPSGCLKVRWRAGEKRTSRSTFVCFDREPSHPTVVFLISSKKLVHYHHLSKRIADCFKILICITIEEYLFIYG